MTDHRLEAPGENGEPVPRDMPDQQADTGEDRWEVAPSDAEADSEKEDERATDVPDTDEAGTGRQGAPHSATVNPEHPTPEEPSA
ncbi:hypothetical protein [Streptomyces sp. S.PNR 29]|uniref:hypothetical protein n=1 Tax=Streptomyces sp. S.PNR 29 TaxID=2973805 RepID=UPI0025AF02FE|nr:hypothetical protein [Streptomyces sp. S.PNR 29]MDN0197690.1 hypothetical protein [Streptomyces sp. S.PNR 29]